MRGPARLLAIAWLVAPPARADEPVNLAAEAAGGQVVYASTREGDPRVLIDGDREGRALAFPRGHFPQAVAIAFQRNRPVEIERVVVHVPAATPEERRVRHLEVQVSAVDGGSDFAAVATLSAAPERAVLDVATPGAVGRFVRVLVHGTHGGDAPAIAEIEVFGRFADDPRITPTEAELAAARRASAAGDLRARRMPLSPLETALLEDASDRRLDRHSLAEAALVAGGAADRAAVDRSLAALEAAVGRARRLGLERAEPIERARRLFEFMHRDLLRGGYEASVSDLGRVLETGRFNCVSSAILYACLLERFEVASGGVEVPGHAFSLLSVPGGTVDVETTCPGWFDSMGDPAALGRLVELSTGFAYVSDRHSRLRREVDPAGLVAIVYRNRGADLARAGRFEPAIGASLKALAIDPASASALQDLIASYNGWALGHARTGRFDDALALLDEARRIHPHDPVFRVNERAVFARWTAELARRGDFAGAVAVADRAIARAPDDDSWREARASVFGRWARAAGSLEAGFAVLDRAGAEPAVRRTEAAWVAEVALERWMAGHAEAALAALARGLERNPSDPLLASNRLAFRAEAGRARLEAGDFPGAIAAWTAGARAGEVEGPLLANCLAAYARWAKDLLAEGRFAEAVAVALRAAADPHLAARGWAERSRALANDLIEAALVEPVNRGDWAASRAILEPALRAAPGLVEPHVGDHLRAYRNGMVVPFNSGDLEATRRIAAAALADPVLALDAAAGRTIAALHKDASIRRAGRLVEEGRPGPGAEVCRAARADALFAADGEARAELARAEGDCRLVEGAAPLEAGDWAAALAAYRAGLAAEPAHEDLLRNLRYAYLQWFKALCDSGRNREAEAVLARALADDPGNARAWRELLEAIR